MRQAAVRIGYLNPFRPFCWQQDGAARGLFVTALQARLPAGTVPLWQPGALEELPRWLEAGQIDAIAAKAIVPERAGAFAFSAPLVETAAALHARFGTDAPAIAAAGGAVIATPETGPLAGGVARLAPGARIVTVADYDAALLAVAEGRADFAALNAEATTPMIADRYAGRIGAAGQRFAPLGLAVAVRAGDPDAVLPRLGL